MAEPSRAEPSLHVHTSESTASFHSQASQLTDWGAEHVLDSGIKLPAGTPTFKLAVSQLRPTQLAVGMHAVREKAAKASKKAAKGPEVLDGFLQSHPVPVVLGPGGRHFLIDHHHLARALHDLGVAHCYAGVVADLSQLNEEQFWAAMAQRRYLWPFDAAGMPVDVHQLPQQLPDSVAGLRDDPYRSLAALVRKAGGYNKTTRPFAEFVWGNYLRGRVPMVLMDAGDVEAYVAKGLSHVMHPDAAELPGYTSLEAATPQQLDAMSCLGRADE